MGEYMDVVRGRVGRRWQDGLSALSVVSGLEARICVYRKSASISAFLTHVPQMAGGKILGASSLSTYKCGSKIPRTNRCKMKCKVLLCNDDVRI